MIVAVEQLVHNANKLVNVLLLFRNSQQLPSSSICESECESLLTEFLSFPFFQRENQRFPKYFCTSLHIYYKKKSMHSNMRCLTGTNFLWLRLWIWPEPKSPSSRQQPDRASEGLWVRECCFIQRLHSRTQSSSYARGLVVGATSELYIHGRLTSVNYIIKK